MDKEIVKCENCRHLNRVHISVTKLDNHSLSIRIPYCFYVDIVVEPSTERQCDYFNSVEKVLSR